MEHKLLKVLFPAIMMVLNLGCAGTSFIGHDWKKGVYWAASALCVAMVGI